MVQFSALLLSLRPKLLTRVSNLNVPVRAHSAYKPEK